MSELKKLQAKWYKKLEKAGFEDIECKDSPREMLKQWEGSYFQTHYTPQEFLRKQRYYELATQFLENYKFKNSRDKGIWAEWCQGKTAAEIARKRQVDPRRYVRPTIRRLERIMLDQYND